MGVKKFHATPTKQDLVTSSGVLYKLSVEHIRPLNMESFITCIAHASDTDNDSGQYWCDRNRVLWLPHKCNWFPSLATRFIVSILLSKLFLSYFSYLHCNTLQLLHKVTIKYNNSVTGNYWFIYTWSIVQQLWQDQLYQSACRS